MNIIKRIVDCLLTVLLLLLMALQVTGDWLHEWLGITMTVTVICHHILNYKWYKSLFKGRYTAYRMALTITDVLLIASFVLTALSGISMSGHAVPFMYGTINVMTARKLHLAFSYWSFTLMGVHIGLHLPSMTSRIKLPGPAASAVTAIFAAAASWGGYLFFKSDIISYLFFKTHFAFLDYQKAKWLVLTENLAMLLFWAFAGYILTKLVRKHPTKSGLLAPLLWLAAVAAAVIVLTLSLRNSNTADSSTSWQSAPAPQTTSQQTPQSAKDNSSAADSTPTANKAVSDGFVLIDRGTFTMGSPDSENWRISDETGHSVTVSAFYIDPYETTQWDYESIVGNNPSTFTGKKLPVDNISWLDAINYANAKSKAAGLTPAYTITDSEITWDRSANGYRLPTEAEWEYACRAGTQTPFNTRHSLSADDANFYGHYPYEIEQNYFDNSPLEAKPGEYRAKTVDVGSFKANSWGLYDCHGNVNEWCWDYYGQYSTSQTTDPTGPTDGTRHIYRGGGWNDFAKNMRSAYRAAAQADMKSYNLGVRLVRNASAVSASVTVKEKSAEKTDSANVLIVYYSWSGNTRGIAKEIQNQTGADIFEITLKTPYSTDYNTVLMQAQQDQHDQARPEINGTVDITKYDTIILGYPNWWASIPMPIATFLESYDLSGKRLLPFCSHGGGRLGQSLTAIAKLAPDCVMGEGLCVHYSGGDSMAQDVSQWLRSNHVKTK